MDVANIALGCFYRPLLCYSCYYYLALLFCNISSNSLARRIFTYISLLDCIPLTGRGKPEAQAQTSALKPVETKSISIQSSSGKEQKLPSHQFKTVLKKCLRGCTKTMQLSLLLTLIECMLCCTSSYILFAFDVPLYDCTEMLVCTCTAGYFVITAAFLIEQGITMCKSKGNELLKVIFFGIGGLLNKTAGILTLVKYNDEECSADCDECWYTLVVGICMIVVAVVMIIDVSWKIIKKRFARI